MSVEASNTEIKLCVKLGLSREETVSFLSALHGGMAAKTALVITHKAPEAYLPPFELDAALRPWLHPKMVILADPSQKTGHHADYANGYYYPLDLSSAWESSVMAQMKPSRRSLDLCAAPGGKSILFHRWQSPQLHFANEVHPQRRGILRQNLTNCGYLDVMAQGMRPEQWALAAPESFDTLLVDAPCSGQSLIAKGIKNQGCFSPTMVQGNAKRQRGIMIAALQCLAPGGQILYTTCTYSPDENEKVLSYILKRYPNLESVEVPLLEDFQSPLFDGYCYRLMPQHGHGAGGFACLLVDRRSPLDLPVLSEDLMRFPLR